VAWLDNEKKQKTTIAQLKIIDRSPIHGAWRERRGSFPVFTLLPVHGFSATDRPAGIPPHRSAW